MGNWKEIFNLSLYQVITCIYNVIVIFCFLFLHIKKRKVSLFYHFIFCFTVILITLCWLIYFPDRLYLNFILTTLVFILAESNGLYLRKNYEDKVNEYQNKVVGQQVDEVQNIYQTMRGWRHDYHNHMQTLKAHLAMKQYDLANEYLNQLEQDLNGIDFLIKTGNMNVDAILNSKLSLANTKDIHINCKATVPKELKVNDIDLCVIIGNLIDNAVESCDEVKDGSEKFLRIYIGIFKHQLYISVTNSTTELIRKLDTEYITKKRGNHGHGLKRINNIVNKYDGYINRKNEPGVFVTEIMLPL